MKHFLKKISNAELYAIVDLFSEPEKVIIFSLLEKKGIFENQNPNIWIFGFDEKKIESILIIFNKNAFLLGNNFLQINKLPNDLRDKIKKCTILGEENVLQAFFGKNKTHFLMKKDFAFLEKKIDKIEKNNDYELVVNSNSKENRIAYAQMKRDFIFEETKKNLSWESLLFSDKEYLNVSPFLLKKGDEIIGMVSANFISKEFAMINLMYIKPEYRKQGLGKYLLLNYINYLHKKSKKICLFYSPDNISAKFLYKNIGFIKNCSWIMAIPL